MAELFERLRVSKGESADSAEGPHPRKGREEAALWGSLWNVQEELGPSLLTLETKAGPFNREEQSPRLWLGEGAEAEAGNLA